MARPTSQNPPRKVIHLVRHAEAEHNVADDFTIPDPRLTDLGVKQARDIERNLAHITGNLKHPIDLIVCSPMRRTIQTTLYGFNQLLKSDQAPAFMVLPDLQESGSLPCDTGSDVSIIEEEYPDIDFSQVTDDWNSKKGPYASNETALRERATRIRKWLRERPERNILVISHGSFIRELTFSHWRDRWRNAECRSFKIGHDPKATLTQFTPTRPQQQL